MTGDRPDDFDDLAARSRDRAFRDADAIADAESALAEVRSGSPTPTAVASSSGRRRVVLAAAALVVVVTASAVVWLTRVTDEQIATSPVTTPTEPPPVPTAVPPTAVPPTTEPPSTEPPTTEPPTTTPTATTSPSTSPTAPPTSSMPPSDIVARADWTSAATDGLWVSRDGTEWRRTTYDQPLTGPALLVDRYVVTQPAVAPEWGHDITAGPITVIADGRADPWTPPQPELEDGSGFSGYELVGVGWLDGGPVFFVRQFERLFPESAYDRLLAVDLRDGTISEIVEFGGWEARTVTALTGEGGAIIVLRRAGTTNEVRVIDAAGSTLFVYELTPDADWSLSRDESGVRAFGFRHGDAGLQLEVVTVDVAVLSAEEQLLDIPVDSTEVLPCGWAHFDGRDLTCARDSGPIAVDIDSGSTTAIGGPTDGLISRRVLPPSDR